MGSFNVGCGISNLSISYGDRAGFVMLMEPKQYLRDTCRDSGKKMYIYTDDLYHAYLPPIFGSYDDYGQLSNVDESVTTKLIEKIFHRPAVDVVNAIGSGRSIYSSSGTLVSLYMDAETSALIGKYGTEDSDIVKALGFTEHEHDYEFEGYVLSNHGRDSWSISSPEDELLKATFHVNYLDEALSAFADVTDLYPGFAREDWYAIKTIHSMSGMFFLEQVFKDMTPLLESDDFLYGRQQEGWEEFIDEVEQLENGTMRFSRMSTEYMRNMALPHEFNNLLLAYKGSNEFQTVTTLRSILTMTNHLLQPSYNGEQNGNTEASIAVAESALRILKARKAEYEDDDYDEEQD